MNTNRTGFLYLLLLYIFLEGCANITAPTGGKRDTIPPKLVSIKPLDSIKNTKPNKIEMHFNEYIVVSDAFKEVQISPMLSIPLTVIGINKKVTVKIPDTLLEDNTTYRIDFGNAIKDLHEGNPFKHYVYSFSTGSYFDSLTLSGSVIDAATGIPDTLGFVQLYYATTTDSEFVRHKPKYVTKIDGNGSFLFKGLPKKDFKMYVLKETNNNFIYDAIGEKIAFYNKTVSSGDTISDPILLRTFIENIDTATKKKTDSVENKGGRFNKSKQNTQEISLSYFVNLDTNDIKRRTFNIMHLDTLNNINILFNASALINKDKISLYTINAEDTMKTNFTFTNDTLHSNLFHITSTWLENTVYILKLVKGFAKDTSGKDVAPSKYVFRTFSDEDYGKINVHLPLIYNKNKYVLQIEADKDTIYQRPISDTIINLVHLKPAKYSFRIIVDDNGNGKWDTGDLFAKIQPEVVIPGNEIVNLKAGWENNMDFEVLKKRKSDNKKDKK